MKRYASCPLSPGGTAGGCGGRSQSRTFGCCQTSRINRAAACSSRGPPASNAAAKSVRNIDSGGTAASGPRSTISRSIVVPERSLPTIKKGVSPAGRDARSSRSPSATLRSPCIPAETAHREHDPDRRPEAEHEQRRQVRADSLARHHRAREAVDQVLEREHLGDRVQEAGRVVGVEEDARDE